jgi:hypothetical protein
MKRVVLSISIVLMCIISLAQVPEKMSYQAVIRDAGNHLVNTTQVGMQISILQGSESGTAVYVETQTPTTNENGLVTIKIGEGTQVSTGTFADIDWSAGPYYIKTETAVEAPLTTYTITGISQILSVPYALNANTAENAYWVKNSNNLSYSSGSVGIGKLPEAMLHVSGTQNLTSVVESSNTIGTSLDIWNSTVSNKYSLSLGGSANSSPGAFCLYDSYAGQARILVKSDGNVGIGTTDPGAYKLNVNGGSVLINDGTGSSGTLKLAGHSWIGSADWGDLRLASGSNSGNSSIRLITENVERVFVTGNGNVGIGIWPAAKLDVNGEINLNNNKITNVAIPVSDNDAANKAYVDSKTPIHYVGESYGGGIVFYVYDNGQHGLIAAEADQNVGAPIRWHGGSYTNTRARSDGVGAGLKNTAIIIANQGPVDGNTFAATVCNEYSVIVGGVTYGDWYLPSKFELNLLYLQKSVVGGFASDYYWSSTESTSNYALVQFFFNGFQGYDWKGNTFYVRAVRAF